MACATHPDHLEINSSEVCEARYFQRSELPDKLAFPGHICPVLETWKAAADDRESAVVEPSTRN